MLSYQQLFQEKTNFRGTAVVRAKLCSGESPSVVDHSASTSVAQDSRGEALLSFENFLTKHLARWKVGQRQSRPNRQSQIAIFALQRVHCVVSGIPGPSANFSQAISSLNSAAEEHNKVIETLDDIGSATSSCRWRGQLQVHRKGRRDSDLHG